MDAVNDSSEVQGYLSIGQAVSTIREEFPDTSASSLRFLEREGLLTVTRTAGGHRLYTSHDVDRVLTIKRWQGHHLSIREIRERLAKLDRLSEPFLLTTECLRLLTDGALEPALRLLLSAADAGLPLEVLFGDVIQPLLIDVGNRWASGDLLVAQEKEVSEVMREAIVELTLRSARTASGPCLIAGCVEGERHELGLRMICGLLRAQEYDVRFLGADVAAPFLCESVLLHRPVAVLLSATMPTHFGAVEAAIEALGSLRNEGPTPTIIVGGRGVADQVERLRELGAFPIAELNPSLSMAAIVKLFPATAPT